MSDSLIAARSTLLDGGSKLLRDRRWPVAPADLLRERGGMRAGALAIAGDAAQQRRAMLDIGLGPALVGAIRRKSIGVDHRHELEVDEIGRAGEVVQVATEARGHNRVAVCRRVEGAHAPPFTATKRDEDVPAPVQSPDLALAERASDQLNRRRVAVPRHQAGK
jgi:hypothetical protein